MIEALSIKWCQGSITRSGFLSLYDMSVRFRILVGVSRPVSDRSLTGVDDG